MGKVNTMHPMLLRNEKFGQHVGKIMLASFLQNAYSTVILCQRIASLTTMSKFFTRELSA